MAEQVGPEFGPLAALAGEWEGDQGVDVAFGNSEGSMITTPYREKITFKPFGPVDNGAQQLYGLDYHMAAWRHGEDKAFHTEIGYWLWDAVLGHVMRCFMVPRGQVLIAGAAVAADATTFTLRSELGSTTYGILSNPYLARAANTTLYEVTVAVSAEGGLSYDSTTTITHARVADPVAHTDRNVLHRVAGA
ncbi:heme-binding beta-barrel domain-containing protein [Parafrankia sp. FMc2]|uniref:heme-binding beta-barrel domain-containing protein n=1 Tax=Parafrankia sp. FMc2 TaxID=3233196 RepID=UPI0034D4591B